MDRVPRRDAFYGKISVTSVLYQYAIPFFISFQSRVAYLNQLLMEPLFHFS
ncbi:MAG: hypothetical protein ACFE9Q_00620 [Candidatus Hodarchaeota archaeon]